MENSRRVSRCLVSLASAVMLTGCATITPQEAGYVIGAIAGGALASAPGAALGAIVGTATGALLGKPFDRRRRAKERESLQDRLDDTAQSTPEATPATTPSQQIERIWIDEHVIDGRVIPGHYSSRATPAL